MGNWATQAREHASRAKAGSSFPFMSLPDDGSVQMILPGSIVEVADRRDPSKKQNHMHAIVLSGSELIKHDDGDSLTMEITSPAVRKLSLNATMTKQYKMIIARYKGDGLPIIEITSNAKRGKWESGRNLKAVGNVDESEIDKLVEASGWEDPDLPF